MRARMVLLAATGMSNAEIGRRLGCDADTVRLWRNRFAVRPKVDALRDQARSGRPARVTPETRIEVVKLACSPPPAGAARTTWSRSALRAALAASCGVSLSESEIGRILRLQELRPHHYRLWLHRPDPEFREKARRVCRLYLSPPPGATVLCVDEKTQIQALRRRFAGRRPEPGLSGRYEFEYRRGGVVGLLAAFDVRTGRVFAQCRPRRTAADLVAFMEAVARRYPRGPVYVVWDNLDIHRDGPDQRWTAFNARHGHRFHFVFTPKHASWLNQVEIWFSLLQRRVIRFGTFTDCPDLRATLLAYVHTWNRREAHPFHWTFRGRFRDDALRTYA